MLRLDARTLGEFGLIDVLRRRADAGRGAWRQAIGDDAAVLRPRAGRELVFTTDALVEGVHFRFQTSDARSLGAKLLEVSLSDLAAMGARPLGFLLSLCLPADAGEERLGGLVHGLLRAARASRCPLVGGDTVRSRHWMFSVTAIGDVPRGGAWLRSTAREGDRLLVTGDLGGSALGLVLLERGDAEARDTRPFLRRQLRPRARLDAAARLRRTRAVTAALDVSDGLLQDCSHIANASGVGAEIHLERLPLPRGLRALCARHDLDPEALACGGGEDFELLFCVASKALSARAFATRLGCRVTEIGVVTPGRHVRLLRDGIEIPPPRFGWDHFKPSAVSSDK